MREGNPSTVILHNRYEHVPHTHSCYQKCYWNDDDNNYYCSFQASPLFRLDNSYRLHFSLGKDSKRSHEGVTCSSIHYYHWVWLTRCVIHANPRPHRGNFCYLPSRKSVVYIYWLPLRRTRLPAYPFFCHPLSWVFNYTGLGQFHNCKSSIFCFHQHRAQYKICCGDIWDTLLFYSHHRALEAD